MGRMYLRADLRNGTKDKVITSEENTSNQYCEASEFFANNGIKSSRTINSGLGLAVDNLINKPNTNSYLYKFHDDSLGGYQVSLFIDEDEWHLMSTWGYSDADKGGFSITKTKEYLSPLNITGSRHKATLGKNLMRQLEPRLTLMEDIEVIPLMLNSIFSLFNKNNFLKYTISYNFIKFLNETRR